MHASYRCRARGSHYTGSQDAGRDEWGRCPRQVSSCFLLFFRLPTASHLTRKGPCRTRVRTFRLSSCRSRKLSPGASGNAGDAPSFWPLVLTVCPHLFVAFGPLGLWEAESHCLVRHAAILNSLTQTLLELPMEDPDPPSRGLLGSQSLAVGPTKTIGSVWVGKTGINKQGFLKDTFCPIETCCFFHPNKGTPPFTRQCSGV